MSNLLTVHQNLPALPVDATSDEVRKKPDGHVQGSPGVF